MNSGIFLALKPASVSSPVVNRPAVTMHSLVIRWLAKVTGQRVITHDGFMAYGRYVKDAKQIEKSPALKQVFDGLIKLNQEGAPNAADKLLSYLVNQNVIPVNVGRQVAIARAAMRTTNRIAEELLMLVRYHDAGRRPDIRSSAPS
jgi:hypothetical protein